VKRNMSRIVKEKEQQQTISLLDFETAKNKKLASLASTLQRPGMTSPLKKLLADCLKTFSRRSEDWTVRGSCYLWFKDL